MNGVPQMSSPAPVLDVLACLNRQLAGAIELRGRVRNAHWNIGDQVSDPAVRLFGDMMREIDHYMHVLAARLTSLGDVLNERALVDCSEKLVYALGINDEYHHVVALSLEFGSFGESARNHYKLLMVSEDRESAQLFCTLARMVDQQLWRAASVTRFLKLCRPVPVKLGNAPKQVRPHDVRGRFAKMMHVRAAEQVPLGG